MAERKKYTFSMDAPECVACHEYKSCKNKRRVACMYLEPLTSQTAAEITGPIMAQVTAPHEFRDVKIGENTTVTIDLVDLKKRMSDEIYKGIRCGFLCGGV